MGAKSTQMSTSKNGKYGIYQDVIKISKYQNIKISKYQNIYQDVIKISGVTALGPNICTRHGYAPR